MYRGKKVELRALKEEDLDFILEYVNNYDIYGSFTDSPITPKSKEFQRKWFDYDNKSIITFAIEDIGAKKIVGTCQLRNLDEFLENAYLSIIIGDLNSQGKGYGKEALKLLLNYAFNELNLHKVSLWVFEYNKSAISLYERVGFKKEGVYKKEIYKAGVFYDEIQYSILQSEFKEEKIND